MNARPLNPSTFFAVTAVTAIFLGGCERIPPLGPEETGVAGSPSEAIRYAGSGDVRPFHLSGTGVFVSQEVAPDPGGSDFGGRCSGLANYVVRFLVTAEGSHLGAVEGEMEHCGYIDFQAGVTNDRDGLLAVTTASGDELRIGYEGTSVSGQFDGVMEITGGTGRFTGASGDGTFVGMADRSTGTLPLVELNGGISYDASDSAD